MRRYRRAEVETPKAGGGQAHGKPCRRPWLFPKEEAHTGNGWFNYWTGEANGDGNNAGIVNLNDGNSNWNNAFNDNPIAVCVP